ncbi:rRNA biogenesis protein rrp5 [Coemansia spiralis]|uniref:rRNA biogenesis protein rrp5 n=2 Tax=Coemansia TaxID=4863 RepID=A0A9W8L164_9FUNG|nr:rRNA biogenesis protein rrp5 [Coemansia umbellata]KAJ2624147.1 rRNA biogenesis protein rrp5 [Coemansia sp. RSA 1358]KAJ2680817.1 rRNA biogenesis protein rrp5 [Coemansia spiralis]
MAKSTDNAAKSGSNKKNSKPKAAVEMGDFPRGGSSGLTPLEFREVSRQAEREVLFADGVTGDKQGKKKRKPAEDGDPTKDSKKKNKSKYNEKTDDDLLQEHSAEDGAETDLLDESRLGRVETLSFKKLTKGALVLGCISAIQELELRVSLPNGIVGVVPITSISPEMTAFVEKAAEESENSDEDNDNVMDIDNQNKDDPLDLSTRFFVGQFVKCVISELGGDQAAASAKQKNKGKSASRIELTLIPEEVNSRIDPDDICEGLIITASIKSVEDRGYVLNTGISGEKIATFLPSDAAQPWLERWMPNAEELKVGQLIEAAVTGVSEDRRSIRVTIDPKIVSQCVVKETFKTMASIQPGQLVSATIMKVWDRGLSLRFMGFYDCAANLKGIGMLGARDKSEVEKKYPFGETIQVRVLYVSLTAAGKTILVSTNPHILQLKPRPEPTGYELPNAALLAAGRAPVSSQADFADEASDGQHGASSATTIADKQMWPIPYGTVLEECTVLSTVGSLGIALQISGVNSVQSFAPLAQLVDEGEDVPALSRHAGRFHIGTRHRARVVGYDAIDATVFLSLRPSVVDDKFFAIGDVRPGMPVSGTVNVYNENGVEIAISPHVRGFIHKEHLSDTPLKHPELYFKPGKQVVCRVLKTMTDQNKVLLTARRSLVQSKLPVVSGYTEDEGAIPGAIVHATVARAAKGGVVVNFYQGANCFIQTEPKTQPTVGQVVKCRILKADPTKHRMSATLNVDSAVAVGDLLERVAAEKNPEYSKDVSQLSVGQTVSGTVVMTDEKFVKLRLDDSNLQARMPIGHLSDYQGAILEKIVSRITAGDRFHSLVVISVNEQHEFANVSAKHSLVRAAETECIPAHVQDIAVGKAYIGWVKNVTDFGVFLSFLAPFTMLAPLANLSDRYISSPKDHFHVDQTVIASVSSVEETVDGSKITASLKTSAADPTATGCLGSDDFLLGYFNALESADGHDVLACIGSQTLVAINQKHPYGLVVSPAVAANQGLPTETMSGFITMDQAKDRISACTENAVVAACVLDVDPEKGIIDYSLRSALVPDRVALESTANANSQSLKVEKSLPEKKLAEVLTLCSDKASTSRKALEKACSEKKTTPLVVEVVKEDYLILSMPRFGNAIAFASTKTYNDRSKPFMRYKVGQRLNGVPVRVEENKRTLVLLKFMADHVKDAENDGAADYTKRPVVQPVDTSIEFFEDYQPGRLTVAKVSSIKGNQANLNLASNVKGRLHITELLDDGTDINPAAKSTAEVFAAAGVHVGKEIKVKVLGMHDAKIYKFLPITHRSSPLKTVIETSVRPSELKEDGAVSECKPRQLTWNTARRGDIVKGFVKGIKLSENKSQTKILISMSLSLTGFLPILTATRSFEVASNPGRYFVTGMPIEVQVTGQDKASKAAYVVPHGAIRSDIAIPLSSTDELVHGARIIASVTKITPLVMFVDIELIQEKLTDKGAKEYRSVHVQGKVDVFDAADVLCENVFVGFVKGQLIEAIVLDAGSKKDIKDVRVRLSTRPSVLDPNKFPPNSAVDPIIASANELCIGQVVHGFVGKTTDVGCFISLGRNVTARALIGELSDEYVRDVAGAFPPGKFVTAVVTSINPERQQVSLSLKPSRIGNTVGPDGKPKRRLDQIGVGETLKGTITRIEDYGVFIKPDDAFVNGLCYVREIADSEVPVDPKSLYEIGDRVLAKVLKVDVATNRLALGLKTSYFARDEESGSDDESNDGIEEEGESEEDGMDVDPNTSSDDEMSVYSKDDDEKREDKDDGRDMDIDGVAKNPLSVSNGFKWDDDSDDSDDQNPTEVEYTSDSDDSADEGGDVVGTKRSKKSSSKRSKMSKISQDVTADLSEQTPKRAMDFERLLVGSPNSSFLWLQFMAFYLGQSEIEQARAVAERALKTISMNEMQEKMNIWVALLNLEHRFGSHESLEATLKRAVQYMNPKHIYLQMAKIYERADQFADAERMHKVATSKFPNSCKVWVLFGLFYLKSNKITESRDLLARALRSLPKRKHIKAITQFGQMEFKNGEPERGRTVLEGVLGTYPKRVDLWSVYLDMEIKAVTSHGLNISDPNGKCWSNTRSLFERVTSMRFSSKKMKFFFKKWLGFEKTHGTDATIEHVKAKALEYVNSLGS